MRKPNPERGYLWKFKKNNHEHLWLIDGHFWLKNIHEHFWLKKTQTFLTKKTHKYLYPPKNKKMEIHDLKPNSIVEVINFHELFLPQKANATFT